ncbi:MAG TPA: tripartite tricarboxylate transporter substrate binding protein [Burkholderiales bacterium]|nr:tripartite tricarboxylate transporter substrate binding protein [Burkholderiales bacterium]
MRTEAAALALVLGATAVVAAHGQTFPTRPVRIVTTAPGAANDLFARMIAQGLTDSFGTQVIVDNRGGGLLAIETAARATPDGYTLLLYSNGLWTLPLVQKVSYDAVRDFAPVSLVGRQPNVLVVHPSLPVSSVKDLVALAKSKPGQLNYGSGSTGSTPHIAAELFKHQAGIDVVRVNYKGAGPALVALVAGEVQLMFPTAGSAAAHVKSGKLKALAVTSAQPSSLAPGLPTVAAAGLPGYESVAPFGIFAPAGTPNAIVQRLSDEIAKVVNRPEVKRRFLDNGVEVVASSPQELAATIKADTTRLTKLVNEAGLRGK